MTAPQRNPRLPPTPDDELLVERLEPSPAGASDYDGNQQDLADRLSLRRVAGLSTELAEVTEVEYRQLLNERVVPYDAFAVWMHAFKLSFER